MILKAIGKTKLQCEKKNGEEKWFKASEAVIKYAKKNFKLGDSIKAEFNTETYIIEKITKMGGEKVGKNIGSESNVGGYTCSDERSVYSAVATMVAGMKLTSVDDVKEAVSELFAQGMELISGKKVTKETSEPEEEPEENTEPSDDED